MKEEIDYYDDSVIIEKGEGFVIIKKKIIFEKGKTTTKGEYSKLNKNQDCAYPERASCNYGEFFTRCPYMECISFGNWKCTFDKNAKN